MPIRQKIIEGRNPLLELCPFCGEPGEIYCVEGEPGCRVRCGNNDCLFKPDSKVPFPTEDHAIKAWNTHKGGVNRSGDMESVKKALSSEYEEGFLF